MMARHDACERFGSLRSEPMAYEDPGKTRAPIVPWRIKSRVEYRGSGNPSSRKRRPMACLSVFENRGYNWKAGDALPRS